MDHSDGEDGAPTPRRSRRGAHRQAELAEPLLRPGDVAVLFHVDPRTVVRWARAGKLTTIRTVGGHRRYRLSEVMALRRAESETVGEVDR